MYFLQLPPTFAEVEEVLGHYSRLGLYDGLLRSDSSTSSGWFDWADYESPDICEAFTKQVKLESDLKEFRRAERKRRKLERAKQLRQELRRQRRRQAQLIAARLENERLEREKREQWEQWEREESERRVRQIQAQRARAVWDALCYRYDIWRLADGSLWLRSPVLQRAPEILQFHSQQRDIQKLWRDTYDRSLHKF